MNQSPRPTSHTRLWTFSVRPMANGFSLIEMLVATAIFSFMVIIIGGIYAQVLGLQRRAQAAARVQENALFVVETVTREIRVSRITSGDSPDCSATQIDLEHPVEGSVTYRLDSTTGAIERNGRSITSPDVEFTAFVFCVTGSGPDDVQARVTMPMTVQNRAMNPNRQVSISIQTTVVSRDLTIDLTN